MTRASSGCAVTAITSTWGCFEGRATSCQERPPSSLRKSPECAPRNRVRPSAVAASACTCSNDGLPWPAPGACLSWAADTGPVASEKAAASAAVTESSFSIRGVLLVVPASQRPGPESAQPQAVRHHGDGAAGHRRAGQDWAQQDPRDRVQGARRHGDQDRVVDEGPEEVLPDGAHRPLREPDGGDDGPEIPG